jgi:Stress responsive A/B Barrel Domain
VITHLVLFTPRADLTIEDRRTLASAFAHAARAIPSVRGVRVGRIIRHGAGYESTTAPAFVAMVEFDDVRGLQAYLEHPAHEGLGLHLRESVSTAAVYDFDVGALDSLADLL